MHTRILTITTVLCVMFLQVLCFNVSAQSNLKVHNVKVYRWSSEDRQWQREERHDFDSASALDALLYATSVKITAGWNATTDAREPVSKLASLYEDYVIPDKIVRWDFDADGTEAWIELVDHKTGLWAMKKRGIGTVATYEQRERTRYSVKMYDRKSKVTMVIYATHGHWKRDGEQQWQLLPHILYFSKGSHLSNYQGLDWSHKSFQPGSDSIEKRFTRSYE